ncbi:MAG: hypothetical protein HUJ51_04025, partial [Eggerthellaceae bacterium]|nr:hypothetical protein [Eggerthellaceae bacterium]
MNTIEPLPKNQEPTDEKIKDSWLASSDAATGSLTKFALFWTVENTSRVARIQHKDYKKSTTCIEKGLYVATFGQADLHAGRRSSRCTSG